MSVSKGTAGVVSVGGSNIGELKSWSISETANTIDTTQLSDSSTTVVSGNTSFSGSCEVFWSKSDTAQDLILIGSSLAFICYPEGTSTGSESMTFTAIITDISRSASIDSTVDASISFTGTGAITYGSVS